MNRVFSKRKLYSIIFKANSPAGKAFDILLLVVIILSVTLVILETIPSINSKYLRTLKILEWIITGIFTLEYCIRIMVLQKSSRYIFSFYGIIDFLAIIPTYISLFFTGAQGLMVIRGLRLLRVFRILKLSRYLDESRIIVEALKASRIKISVFIFAIMMIIIIIGTLMYLVEGEGSGFNSIPSGIYWAIVTLTTVGYGDITPLTPLGKFISGVVMILGYAIIAVPTGIVTAELTRKYRTGGKNKICSGCGLEFHETDAVFCRKCGSKIEDL